MSRPAANMCTPGCTRQQVGGRLKDVDGADEVSLLVASRFVPAWAKPIVLSNKLSSAVAHPTIVELVVLAASSTVRMFWAAAL